MSKHDTYLGQAFSFLSNLIDEHVVEISINPDYQVWIERRGDGHMKLAPVKPSNQDVLSLINSIANEASVPVSSKKPVFSCSIQYHGHLVRVQALLPPAVESGCAISMRFFNPTQKIFEPTLLYGRTVSSAKERIKRNEKTRTLVENDQLIEALAYCIEQKLNVVVSGGTNSGKTMVARYLQKLISDEERIITIEDAPDLLPQQPNKIMMVSKEGDAYRSPDKLLQASLRLRPDRIILSEVRGKDAYTFLKAINTGHGGSITTVHADTAPLAVSRLAQASLEADPGMSFAEMKSLIRESIDLFIHTTKTTDGRRGITEFFLPASDLI